MRALPDGHLLNRPPRLSRATDSGIIEVNWWYKEMDAIIAATALQHGLTLVTFNPKDLGLPGLQLYPLDY